MARIFIGRLSGSGGGGGGSVNPTSGYMPVNLFGSFIDSIVQATGDLGNGTVVRFDDGLLLIELLVNGGSSSFIMDGGSDDVRIDGFNGIKLNGGVFINNHLGSSILRWLSNGAGDPALKANGTLLELVNGNDTAYCDFKSRSVTTVGAIQSGSDLNSSGRILFDAKTVLQSATDGILTITNNAGTGFTRLTFGGITNLFPSLQRNATALECRDATGVNYVPFRSGTFTVDGGQISIIGTMNIYAGISTSNSILYGNLAGVSIGKGSSLPVASALFELSSNSKGFLPPRMTQANRTAISSPATGLIVYQTDGTEGLYIYKSTGWTFII